MLNKKKLLSVFLASVMTVSAMSTLALADESIVLDEYSGIEIADTQTADTVNAIDGTLIGTQNFKVEEGAPVEKLEFYLLNDKINHISVFVDFSTFAQKNPTQYNETKYFVVHLYNQTTGTSYKSAFWTMLKQRSLPLEDYPEIKEGDKLQIMLEGFRADKTEGNAYYFSSQAVTVPTHTHDWEIEGAKAATCRQEGTTGNKRCKICGELEQGTIIPATGHKWGKPFNVKEATCTEAGFSGYQRCSNCTAIRKGAVTPALEHDWVAEGKKEPTCTEAGSTGNQRCKRCGELKQGTSIPATGHKETEIKNKKAATCTESGYTGDEVCKACGETVKKGTVISATGHKTQNNNAKPATCTENGYTGDGKCTVCGQVSKGEVIPALGHTIVTIPAVEATYAKEGSTEGSHCSVCGTYFASPVSLPKKPVPMVDGLTLSNTRKGRLTVAWDENETLAGYQIKYATNAKFRGATTKRISDSEKTSFSYKGIARKTKCYVRIRGFVMEDGKRIYSEWSTTKKLTIKK